MPKLSICIPTRNRAVRLATCLSHIDELQFRDFEVVISDNASSDNTEAVVEQFRERLPSIYYFRQEVELNRFQTQLPAFNLARGDYLVYLADDDYLIEEGLLKAIDELENNADVAVVFGTWLKVRECDGAIESIRQDESKHGRRSLSNLHEVIDSINSVEMPIMRREAYRKALMPFQYQLSFDFFGMTNLMKMGDVIFIEDPIHGVVQHAEQGSRSMFEDEHLSSYLADYELAVVGMPNLSPKRRQVFIAQKLAQQYVVGALTAFDRGMYLRGRNLTIRARAYGLEAANHLAKLVDEGLRAHIVAQTIILCMRTSGATDLLVVEGHEKTQSIVDAYLIASPEAEVIVATSQTLSQLPCEEREYFLYVDPELFQSRQEISEGPIRRSAQIDELSNLCKIVA